MAYKTYRHNTQAFKINDVAGLANRCYLHESGGYDPRRRLVAIQEFLRILIRGVKFPCYWHCFKALVT